MSNARYYIKVTTSTDCIHFSQSFFTILVTSNEFSQINIFIKKKHTTSNDSTDSFSTTIVALFVQFLDFTVVHPSFSLMILDELSSSNNTSSALNSDSGQTANVVNCQKDVGNSDTQPEFRLCVF